MSYMWLNVRFTALLGGCHELPKCSECFAVWLLGCYYVVTKVF